MQRLIKEQDIQNYQEELSQEALADAIEKLDGLQIPYEKRLLTGQPARKICHVAAECFIDCDGITRDGRFKGNVLRKCQLRRAS